MLKEATRQKLDVVMARSVDRLTWSLIDLVGRLQKLYGTHVDLFLHQQAIDTTTPAGRAMFGMLGGLAEFERSIIVSRINAGIATVWETGKTKSGKPIGWPMISADTETTIRARFQAGAGVLKVAGKFGVGSSVVQRVKRTMKASETNWLG
jgi:DNA invertase Pin-like site-specific DNA recombinase